MKKLMLNLMQQIRIKKNSWKKKHSGIIGKKYKDNRISNRWK